MATKQRTQTTPEAERGTGNGSTFHFSPKFFATLALLFFCSAAFSQTFSGINNPGASSTFSFSVPSSATNFGVNVTGGTSTYSCLYLKRGSAPTATSFDFTSQFLSQSNWLNLELPQAASGTWFALVSTPTNSAKHTFTLTAQNNAAYMRTRRPVSKPPSFSVDGTLAKGEWNYFRIEAPTTPVSLKISATGSSTNFTFFVQRGRIPGSAAYLKKSNGADQTIYLSESEMTGGSYFIGINSISGTTYTLKSEIIKVTALTWDAGTSDAGTSVSANSTTTAAASFYFKVRTQSPANGGWRTALRVLKGEADLYMSRGTIPGLATATFSSARKGSDGVVLGSKQFTAGEDWYLMVRASTNAQFQILSGTAYVQDLGVVGTNFVSTTFGAEGWRFFKTTTPSDLLAWRLWARSGTNMIFLKKAGVPLNFPLAFEMSQAGQMLVVPPYLVGGQLYYVGVQGAPGTSINFDSRRQLIENLPFLATTNVNLSGGYSTFRISVPTNALTWELDVTPGSGTVADLYVRRNSVPSENYNEAYSEAPGVVAESLSIVPPLLSDGTFYVTVAGTNNLTFSLTSRKPTVTDIHYVDKVTNDETNRVGWRYYRILNVDEQLGSLGWDLALQKFIPGTKIALRRNQAPSIWNSRNGSKNLPANNYDYLSIRDFLQRPNHQADVWYIGVFNPNKALGPFTLITTDILSPLLVGTSFGGGGGGGGGGIGGGGFSGGGGGSSPDGSYISYTNLAPGRWQYFQMDIPSTISGWDLRLTGVTSGVPKIVVRREFLPEPIFSSGIMTTNVATTFGVATLTNWPTGKQWATGKDWTRRYKSALGQDETGRLLAMGMRRPLEPATYYVGVYNIGGASANFTINNHFIGRSNSIVLHELAFTNGVATGTLAPRQAAYYHIRIPAKSRSWKAKLSVSTGEAMMLVSTNGLPNVESEKRMQKADDEHYVLLPQYKTTNILEVTDCYIAVIGEGINATSDRIGSQNSSYTLQTFGLLAEPFMGTVSTSPLTWSGSAEGGEVKAYHFDEAVGVPGVYITLENREGNPVMVWTGGTDFPDPGYSSDLYGNEGGIKGPPERTPSSPLKILASTTPGRDTLMVKARGEGTNYTNATFKVRVEPISPAICSGAGKSVCPQTNFWEFFRVDVPSTVTGWDVRLENVTRGLPKLLVCRGQVPWKLSSVPGDIYTGTNWEQSGIFAATRDWTGRGFNALGATNEDGRILTVGMNKPLVPGTYYLGVYGLGSCYDIRSRFIGPGLSIPLNQLSFSGSFSSNLPPREAAFFRVKIPSGTRGWKLQLKPSGSGEAMMAVLKGALPNIAAAPSFTSTNFIETAHTAGRKIQQNGLENFMLLPCKGKTNLDPGDYYVAVASEGNNPLNANWIGTNKTSFTLSSGPMSVVDLGELTTSAIHSNKLTAGECATYSFNVPPGTTSIQARLENRVGNPVMALRSGNFMPDPNLSFSGASGNAYGADGGEAGGTLTGANILSVPNPTNGNFMLIVKARPTNNIATNASYTLRLTVVGPSPLAFSGGKVTVTNQSVGAMNYFRVDVPTNVNLLGWDLRLTNVISGQPKIVVRRDAIPDGFVNKGWASPGNMTNWASSNQWAANFDWTRRTFSADGQVNESGRILVAAMGRPLEPGTYYIGIGGTVLTDTNAMSYTLWSRGIGSTFTIPVRTISFVNGIATNIITAPREPSYYKVAVPENTPSWKMKVTGSDGEVMLAALKGALPGTDYIDPSHTIAQGKAIQKPGNEHCLLLPSGTNAFIAGGDYYLAVIGEGTTATNTSRIGIGNSKFAIHSIGSLPVQFLGNISTTSIDKIETLEAGECKAYKFATRTNVLAVEVQLENRSGNPVAFFHTNALPDPGDGFNFGTIAAENYGTDGGVTATYAHQFILTAPHHPEESLYQTNIVLIKARSSGNGVYPDAGYKLRVREMLATNLNFSTSGNVISGQVEDNQRAFYKVTVPSDFHLGWKLELRQTSGQAFVRVRKDFPPQDSPQLGTAFDSPAAYIVPPYLTNGTWYVEVKGKNSTAYTLTSSPLDLERPAWTMGTAAPGTTLPDFGDTGVTTGGNPLAGDQGIDLEQGYHNYYAVEIPAVNPGLIRFELNAINGNPDLYIRTNDAPTLSHSAQGAPGTIFERSMVGKGTQYANWVPFNGTQTALTPGLWYFCVRANGNANARYRVRLSLGDVKSISLNGATLTGQVIAATDFRYYKFQLPGNVNAWSVNFAQESGDVYLYLRDTIPPGHGASQTDFRHAGSDGVAFKVLDLPGTYGFGSPPSVPGSTYYLGFRALNDASFSVRIFSGTNGFAAASSSTIKFSSSGSLNNVLQLQQPVMNSNGQFQFNISGQPQSVYFLEFSTNLIDWMPLSMFTNENSGTTPVFDFGSTNSTTRFYRVRGE